MPFMVQALGAEGQRLQFDLEVVTADDEALTKVEPVSGGAVDAGVEMKLRAAGFTRGYPATVRTCPPS